MEMKIENVLGTENKSYIWSLYVNNSQLCCSQIFENESDAINNANVFIDLFNSSEKLEKKKPKKRMFGLIFGNK